MQVLEWHPLWWIQLKIHAPFWEIPVHWGFIQGILWSLLGIALTICVAEWLLAVPVCFFWLDPLIFPTSLCWIHSPGWLYSFSPFLTMPNSITSPGRAKLPLRLFGFLSFHSTLLVLFVWFLVENLIPALMWILQVKLTEFKLLVCNKYHHPAKLLFTPVNINSDAFG